MTFLLICALVGDAAAGDRRMAALPPLGTLELVDRPAGYRDEDSFYREYYSALDDRIEDAYLDAWTYTEKPASWHNDFAQQVLRLRVDATWKSYFAPKDRAVTLKRVHKVIHEMRDMPVRLSDEPGGGGGELKFGYDVFTDASKVEYSHGALQAGVYHPHLMSALTGSKPALDVLSLRVSYSGMRLAYTVGGDSVEAAVSRSLAEGVSGEIVSSHPLRQDVPGLQSRYELRLSFGF